MATRSSRPVSAPARPNAGQSRSQAPPKPLPGSLSASKVGTDCKIYLPPHMRQRMLSHANHFIKYCQDTLGQRVVGYRQLIKEYKTRFNSPLFITKCFFQSQKKVFQCMPAPYPIDMTVALALQPAKDQPVANVVKDVLSTQSKPKASTARKKSVDKRPAVQPAKKMQRMSTEASKNISSVTVETNTSDPSVEDASISVDVASRLDASVDASKLEDLSVEGASKLDLSVDDASRLDTSVDASEGALKLDPSVEDASKLEDLSVEDASRLSPSVGDASRLDPSAEGTKISTEDSEQEMLNELVRILLEHNRMCFLSDLLQDPKLEELLDKNPALELDRAFFDSRVEFTIQVDPFGEETDDFYIILSPSGRGSGEIAERGTAAGLTSSESRRKGSPWGSGRAGEANERKKLKKKKKTKKGHPDSHKDWDRETGDGGGPVDRQKAGERGGGGGGKKKGRRHKGHVIPIYGSGLPFYNTRPQSEISD